MKPMIYKPSIYKGAGIYKTGGDGGGSGKTGIIYEFDFLNYPTPSLDGKTLIPAEGDIFFCPGLSNNASITTNGLEMGNNSSSFSQRLTLFGYSANKVKFRQITKGLTDGSNWALIGSSILGYANNWSANRGMGIYVDNALKNYGYFENGCSAPWQLADSGFYSGYGCLIIPQSPLLPISQSTIDNEALFDFENNAISFKINGVEAFTCSGLPRELFIAEFYRASNFNNQYGGLRLAIEKLTIECFD